MNSKPSILKKIFLCLLSACLVWFSFPSFLCKTLTPPTAFLGWIALIPFFIALRGTTPRQGALLGWIFGFAQLGGILYWIAFLEAAHYLSGPAWVVLVFYLSLYFMIFGWAFRSTVKRWGENAWTAPVLWVGLEYIRGSRPWGGFSWGELGYSQAPYPFVLTFASWAGVYGLTYIMVWFNASIAKWIGENWKNPDISSISKPSLLWIGLGVPLGVLTLILAMGSMEIKEARLRAVGSVALLQPSIDQDVKWSKENEAATYNKIGGLVRGIGKTNLVIWPETAAPSYLLWTAKDLARVVSIVRGSKTVNLVGCLDAQKQNRVIHCYNAAVQFGANGNPEGVYHKCHLVPFGEFVPFQKYLTFLGPVVGDLGDFDAGESYLKFNAQGFTYTPMICYEVIFPGDVQRAFQTGADALVNISNDAWYGRTASPYQHAMMAVVRAAEERKPLLRAANTGICMLTDPFGRITASTRLFDETILKGNVLLSDSPPTFYSKWGNWLPRLCWITVFLLALSNWRGYFKGSDKSLVGHETEKGV